MPTFILLIILLFASLSIQAQPVKVSVFVNRLPAGKVYLCQVRGEDHKLIDSLFVTGGAVNFTVKDPVPGVYRIMPGRSPKQELYEEEFRYIDFIINKESEIILRTDFYVPLDSMNVITSEENQHYLNFLRKSRQYRTKAGRILPLFSVYYPEDEFFDHVKNEFARLQQQYNDSIIYLANQKPGSFSSSLIRFSLLPQVDPAEGFERMTEFLKTHYFDLVSFTDERLINSQAYTQKILEFLSLFQTSETDQHKQEDLYIQAVDIIMERASYNESVFDFILNFLVDGFDSFKMENVLVHLAENYVEQGCETDSKKIMEQRLDAFKKMAVGNTVNDIVLLDVEGKTRKLSDLKNEYVLALFWASWCPHCTRLLSDLKKWYVHDRKIDLEIFSVSIDTSHFDWEENLLINDYPWINVCNLQGWEGKVAADYNIYATPTMFIIDRKRRILSKPLTFREFRREIDKLSANP